MDEQQLGAFIDEHFTRDLFRLEVRDRYAVSSDGDDLEAYLAGRPGPDMARKGPWLDVIRGEVARGLTTYRVHVVTGPLSPYLRFEFEWGYVLNQDAGERIRILDLAEQQLPDVEGLVLEDFWLITGQPDRVAAMTYDDADRFVSAQAVPEVDLPRYQRTRAALWDAAVPFASYWQAHPHYARDRRAAA